MEHHHCDPRVGLTGTLPAYITKFMIYYRIGPFGEGANCMEIKLATNYILFLRKRTLFGITHYSMTFNPVPLSATNEDYFIRVLRGNMLMTF